jgi:hypothetical protein
MYKSHCDSPHSAEPFGSVSVGGMKTTCKDWGGGDSINTLPNYPTAAAKGIICNKHLLRNYFVFLIFSSVLYVLPE